MQRDLKFLEKILKIKFKNKDILKQALVHRSYLNENSRFPLDHNERLEFLGDAVLELITTEFLFKNYPHTPEGEMTNWRAALVNSVMLAKAAKKLNLEKFLYLSHGEAKDKNDKARQYILANAMEAVIGAVYLDQGFSKARDLVGWLILVDLPNILKNKLYLDPKTRFQESAQEIVSITPAYKVLAEAGPDHNKKFVVGVFLGSELVAKGTGLSKQEAQTQAAENGLKKKGW